MITKTLEHILSTRLSPLDLLPHGDIREKLVNLVIRGIPEHSHTETEVQLRKLRDELLRADVSQTKVVVFGGGTGLSNIVGGDSRAPGWRDSPFSGLKEVFVDVGAVVCVTDNGGSTGELLKDLPLIALGDMRHVLLSSIRRKGLREKYGLTNSDAICTTGILERIFNWRFSGPLTPDHTGFVELSKNLSKVPEPVAVELHALTEHLFADERLKKVITRSHCLGNLLIVAAIYSAIPPEIGNDVLLERQDILYDAVWNGVERIATLFGCSKRAVLPCTPTPAQLRVIYTNGVEIPGEHKLSDAARGVPVSRVEVDYSSPVYTYQAVVKDIEEADIIIFAPGSLYSSIIPIFKVPGLAEAVRCNSKAMKVLVSNLWVQAGETDLAIVDPGRKFHISDMIRAYEKNIPGGTKGLFNEVICVSLKDIPASVLQRYAVEGKVPIYLDRETIQAQGYVPIECDIHSREALARRGVIQHDPDALALTIKTLFAGANFFVRKGVPSERVGRNDEKSENSEKKLSSFGELPCRRYQRLTKRLEEISIRLGTVQNPVEVDDFRKRLMAILWNHPLIPEDHLNYFEGVNCIDKRAWRRDQKWDNVFSFYDPHDGCIKIRKDQLDSDLKLEVALLIALGESLLGDYALKKEMRDVKEQSLSLGRVYHLFVREEKDSHCYFSQEELQRYLRLARMCPGRNENHFTRLVNRGEGFTPPGLLMGLMYAWYVDNRHATHIEYKMSVMKINKTDLIPEQLRMLERRKQMITFFRDVVFGKKTREKGGGRIEQGSL